MLRFALRAPLVCALVAPVLGSFLASGDARACGGCFHEPVHLQIAVSVVTEHRMAFALSPQQTVLWDQIRYSGSPSGFAWVLPVKAGARIEASSDAWLAALDASTETVIVGPTPSCGAPPPVERGGGGGCGSSMGNSVAYEPAEDGGLDGSSTVQVISQTVVGPYDSVTVRSSQGEALGAWLVANGYEIPSGTQPTIDAYAAEGFDFIALKLQPNVGVQAMRPVRVITPGADATLPLRMVAAGVGSHVGLELFVLSGGRYHTQNFADATIDFTQLKWDPYADVSNYTTLATQAMAAKGGTAWLTEYSGPADLDAYPSFQNNPSLAYAYTSTCVPQQVSGCRAGDAGADSGAGAGAGADGGAGAGADSGAVAEAAADALSDAAAVTDDEAASDGAAVLDDASTTPDAAALSTPPPMCAAPVICDDLSLAMTGLPAGSVWVTRLRADLPAGALGSDLLLEATASQDAVTNLHTTQTYTDPKYDPCAGSNGVTGGAGGVGCACRTAESPRDRYLDTIAVSFGAALLVLGSRRRRPRG